MVTVSWGSPSWRPVVEEQDQNPMAVHSMGSSPLASSCPEDFASLYLKQWWWESPAWESITLYLEVNDAV